MGKSEIELKEFRISLFCREGERHNFSNIHPGFLVAREIIQPDWKAESFEIGNASFSIRYGNGVEVTGNESLLEVVQRDGLEIGKETELPEIATSYIVSSARNIFSRVGMEWTFAIQLEGSPTWIHNHFVRSEVVPSSWGDVFANILLGVIADNLLMSYQFSPDITRIPDDDDELQAGKFTLEVLCRIGSNSEFDDTGLRRMILDTLKYEEVLLDNLQVLMEDKNDSE